MNVLTRTLTGPISNLFLQRARKTADLAEDYLTYDEFYAELKRLRLDARYFHWWEYRDELAAYLNITIEVKFVEQHTEPILAMLLTQEGKPGLLFRDSRTGDARILVSGQLTEPATLQIIYHELGHVAGGHELPSGAQFAGIAGKLAPANKDLCENDARLRAEYALQASHYGCEDYRTDDWFFW